MNQPCDLVRVPIVYSAVPVLPYTPGGKPTPAAVPIVTTACIIGRSVLRTTGLIVGELRERGVAGDREGPEKGGGPEPLVLVVVDLKAVDCHLARALHGALGSHALLGQG